MGVRSLKDISLEVGPPFLGLGHLRLGGGGAQLSAVIPHGRSYGLR
jgi:hypothetical protein